MRKSEIEKKELMSRFRRLGINPGDLFETMGRNRYFLNYRADAPLWLFRTLELLEEQKKLQDELKRGF